ncbi:hypothetical protein FHU41_002621 [Psychromicrobium silvestre]|uniref:DUF6314 domain-containing protein n=1 Tax=Psychromicrobium silvestre TaxID=1645614 RepID=A0A7Y9LVK5_9MICC|nr:DUF6314 family protein [Psychromicrobium silvestre]NYE96371.1 hypothetical protein [Psychromicrobium silvestre]
MQHSYPEADTLRQDPQHCSVDAAERAARQNQVRNQNPAEPALTVPDLAAFLIGSWRIERTVLDRASGQSGTFEGQLVFTTPQHPELKNSAHGDGTVLRYSETGKLRWAGTQAPVKRDYLLHSTDNPAVLDWYFDYGGYFHSLDLRTGQWRAEHPCSADRYRVEYAVHSAELLEVSWDVAGPTKDQLLHSLWRRLPEKQS